MKGSPFDLALSPPLNPRKFAIRPNGDVFTRYEWDAVYQFAAGDRPDCDRHEPQRVEDGCLPVLYADWREGGLSWSQGYAVTALGGRFDDPTSNTVLVTRISARNEGNAPATARLWLSLRRGEDECAEAPREWFEPGKAIKIRNAPTSFGPVTYEIDSAPRKIMANVELAARRKPKSFTIRFRHPKEAGIKSVKVNGKPWRKFDASRETIELPVKGGKVEVEADY